MLVRGLRAGGVGRWDRRGVARGLLRLVGPLEEVAEEHGRRHGAAADAGLAVAAAATDLDLFTDPGDDGLAVEHGRGEASKSTL